MEFIRRAWNWLKYRWRKRKRSKLLKLVETRKNAKVLRIIEEVLYDAHDNLDLAFKDFITPDLLDRISQAESKLEVRLILKTLAKRCRTLVTLPLVSDLMSPKVPKRWDVAAEQKADDVEESD